MISRFVTIAGMALLCGSLVSMPAVAAKTDEACDLITAEAVHSIIDSGSMTKVTTSRSPDSLCEFANFGSTGEAWIVTVTLFTPRTLREPSVGSVLAKVGCRTEGQACEKAIGDDSPAELYRAQPHGKEFFCSRNTQTSCFVSDLGVVWARQGDEVVAIAAAKGVRADAGAPQKPVWVPSKALSLLDYVSLKL